MYVYLRLKCSVHAVLWRLHLLTALFMQSKLQDAVIVYARPEDEFYHKHCSWSCTFPITTREVEKDELHPLRMVLGITSQQAISARCDTGFIC